MQSNCWRRADLILVPAEEDPKERHFDDVRVLTDGPWLHILVDYGCPGAFVFTVPTSAVVSLNWANDGAWVLERFPNTEPVDPAPVLIRATGVHHRAYHSPLSPCGWVTSSPRGMSNFRVVSEAMATERGLQPCSACWNERREVD